MKLHHANEGIVFTVRSQRAEHGAHLDVVERARPSRPAKRRDDSGDSVMLDQTGPSSNVAVDRPEAAKRMNKTVPGERGPPGKPGPPDFNHVQCVSDEIQLAAYTKTPPHVGAKGLIKPIPESRSEGTNRHEKLFRDPRQHREKSGLQVRLRGLNSRVEPSPSVFHTLLGGGGAPIQNALQKSGGLDRGRRRYSSGHVP